MNEFIRSCPGCQAEMNYPTLNWMKSSEEKGKVCRKCITKRENGKGKGVNLFRVCPECNEQILYTNKNSFNIATERGSICQSCSGKGDRNSMFGRIGETNPNFGAIYSEERKKQMSEVRKGKSFHTEESKRKISEYQKENAPMRGRSVYSVWIEKYGEEIANEKMLSYKNKQSENSSGEKNPMFGKPSPNGSGNGYSGWYNGFFFRSLRELMFLIYCKRFNIELKSLESKKDSVKYIDHTGQERNYFADYIVGGKYFVEIKPKKLWNTPTNKAKFESAKKACESNGLIFKVIDPIVNGRLILKTFLAGEIKFLDRYLEKFKKWNSLE